MGRTKKEHGCRQAKPWDVPLERIARKASPNTVRVTERMVVVQGEPSREHWTAVYWPPPAQPTAPVALPQPLKRGDVVWATTGIREAPPTVRITRMEVKDVMAGKITRARLESDKGEVASLMPEDVRRQHRFNRIDTQLSDFTREHPGEYLKAQGIKIAP